MLDLDTQSKASQWDEHDFTPLFLSSWTKENDVLLACDLHTIASIGDHVNFQRCIERDGTSLSMKNTEGWTPLMYACYNGCGKTVELVVNSGATKDGRNLESKTALMIAAHHGNCEAIRLFPEKIHLDTEDDRGWTALFYAVDGGHHSAVNILIRNGSNINKVDKYDGFTVTMIAAMGGKDSMMKLLLNNGADLTIRSIEGHTANSLAMFKGHNNLIQIIESYLPKEIVKKIGVTRELIEGSTWRQHDQESRETHTVSSNLGCPTSQILEIAMKQINLSNILRLHNMEKYCSIFEEQNVDLGTFLTLSEEELKNLGVKLFGPRRKMSLLIKHWNCCDICQNIAH